MTLFGKNVVFYTIQASTALILILAANTSYADFPRLSAILAKDKFLPQQFSFRGDRLGFSHGIFVLAAAAGAMLVAFDADVDKLIPLYAFGVFVSFTLSQSGMVVHWLRSREPGWRRSIAVNAVGAIATGVVACIIGGTKFIDGAWISMILMVILGLMFAGVRRHYARVRTQLELPPEAPPAGAGASRRVVVPVGDISAPVLRTLAYARALSDHVVAVHVASSDEDAARLARSWAELVPGVPLAVIDSPGGSFVAPMLRYLDMVRLEDPDAEIMVAVPQLIVSRFWERPLHNQTGARLKRALSRRPRTIIVEVPYQLS
jgi:hypothetical protein